MLSAAETTQLGAWARRGNTGQSLASRARIVLACAQGANNAVAARTLRVTPQTVAKWRSRFLAHRLDGLIDQPRPGAPRKIGRAEVERVIASTLCESPGEGTRWSTRSLAQHVGLSQSAISRIWRDFGLQPKHEEAFRLSTTPGFVGKVRDIAGVFVQPPLKAMALCIDEKRRIPAHHPPPPVLLEHRSHEQVRYGATTLFAALDAAAHLMVGELQRGPLAKQLLRFLSAIERQVPAAFDVHLIMIEHSAQTTAAVRAWFERRSRFHVHRPPTPSAWVKQAERWFTLLAQPPLERSTPRSTMALAQAMRGYLASGHKQPEGFVWIKEAPCDAAGRAGPAASDF